MKWYLDLYYVHKRWHWVTLLLHYNIEWCWGYKLSLTPEPSTTFQVLVVEWKWTEVFMMNYEMRTFSSEDPESLTECMGFTWWIFHNWNKESAFSCSLPSVQGLRDKSFSLEKKKKKLGWTIRPSKEDTKRRLLCGDSEMNEFFWMLSNCSEFWDYCKPRQIHSRDKCVKSLNSKRNLPVFII